MAFLSPALVNHLLKLIRLIDYSAEPLYLQNQTLYVSVAPSVAAPKKPEFVVTDRQEGWKGHGNGRILYIYTVS
ncbi:hypothetical protein BURK_003597 [Burkholderia sp. SJ98]|nr:hypothetical protein BURK_003597 [Burkholderia sp. SJ98]